EGTLAGAALARWGLLLSAFVGLGYFAYEWAVSAAISQQADTFAREWLDLLRKDQVAKAAWRTLHPQQRANIREDDPGLERKLEARVSENAPGTLLLSMLGSVRQHPLARLILQGGAETTFEARGVKAWEYTRGGYQVVLSYHVVTPEAVVEAVVTVHGVD